MSETIENLKPDPQNANKGTPRGHGIIEQSIRRHGAGRSGLAAKDGTMIAGSQTLEEIAALGIPIKPVHTTGDEWVVVIRDDIEPGSEQATLMAIEDNRSSETGLSWDASVLAGLAEEGVDLSGLFYPTEMATILDQAGTEIIDANELWKGMPEFEHEDQTADAAFTIRVFLKDADELAAFGKLLGKDLTGRKFVWFGKQPQGETYEAVE